MPAALEEKTAATRASTAAAAIENEAAGAPRAVHATLAYLLHLADNALVLGQRNAEWCGHAPILEEDLAMANHSLDQIGQARLLYQHAAACIEAGDGAVPRGPAWPAGAVTEDTLAYFRDGAEFLNYTLLELPHHTGLVPAAGGARDWAVSIARNFLHAALMALLWERLAASRDAQLAAIAAKSLKEVRYHLRHSRDWLVRLGDGTAESHRRAQAALDYLLPFTDEFWSAGGPDEAAAADATGCAAASVRGEWDAIVDEAIAEATLTRPAPWDGYVSEGKRGIHSEHLAYLLAEMQSLARAHPGAVW